MLRAGLTAFIAGFVFPSAAQEYPPVSLYVQEDAIRLARTPQSHMLDEVTCERVEGIMWSSGGDRQLLRPGGTAVLYRNRQRTPFMEVVARDDGVFVARFPARPGEVIYSQMVAIDEITGQRWYGKGRFKSVCLGGEVQVGDAIPIEKKD